MIECCSSDRGKVVIGCDNDTVNFLDRGLNFSYGFQAHSSSVLFLQQLKAVTRAVLLKLPFTTIFEYLQVYHNMGMSQIVHLKYYSSQTKFRIHVCRIWRTRLIEPDHKVMKNCCVTNYCLCLTKLLNLLILLLSVLRKFCLQ